MFFQYIAVDFDGTLCNHEYPKIGKVEDVHKKVVRFIRRQKFMGAKIILWTCREGYYLKQAVDYCLEEGIPIDYVNENPEVVFSENSVQRKIYADLYLDDKALNINSLPEE